MNMGEIRTLLRAVEAQYRGRTLTKSEYAAAIAKLSTLVPKTSNRSPSLFEALKVFAPE